MAMVETRRVDAVDAPADDYDVGAAFGEHTIEWWMHDGTQLVPAPAPQAALLSQLHDSGPHRARQRPWRGRPFAGRLVVLAMRILRKS